MSIVWILNSYTGSTGKLLNMSFPYIRQGKDLQRQESKNQRFTDNKYRLLLIECGNDGVLQVPHCNAFIIMLFSCTHY